MVTLTTHVIAGSDLHCVGLLARLDFRNIFLPDTGEDQKKSYVSAGPLALSHVLNPSLVITLRSVSGHES